jgi:non-ribosomal peptide synthetase component F
VLYAAGGRPVAVTHAAAVNLATALGAGMGIGPADTMLVLPRALATDPVAALWMGLISGARIVLASAEIAAQGSRLRRLIVAEDVTLLQASPSEWQSLIDTGLRAVRGLRALSGGAPFSRQLAVQILERCRVL